MDDQVKKTKDSKHEVKLTKGQYKAMLARLLEQGEGPSEMAPPMGMTPGGMSMGMSQSRQMPGLPQPPNMPSPASIQQTPEDPRRQQIIQQMMQQMQGQQQQGMPPGALPPQMQEQGMDPRLRSLGAIFGR